MKKYNYKYLIGFILGIILFGGSVYASILYSSNIVHYDSTSSSLNSTNVQAAINELAARPEYNLTTCPSDKVCIQMKNTLALGDYISYTPSRTSYTTDTSKTGYTSAQTINPSELNLWRVIAINEDGTFDIISENVSGSAVFFKGKIGYQNIVGYLNVLASQYETSGITIGSRHFGYNGQTEYITDTSKFVNPAPWTCPTGGSCNPVESQGGGDTLYTSDYNLINTVLGTREAANTYETTPISYWMASRSYYYMSATSYFWYGRRVDSSGSSSTYYLYGYDSSSFRIYSTGFALRPIVTLKSGLSYYGGGSKDYPMEIQ